MGKPAVTTVHMSPSGKHAWVKNSRRKMPFPVMTIHGKAPTNKDGTKLKVPKELRGYFINWVRPKKYEWYSPDPRKHRGKGNCAGAGVP